MDLHHVIAIATTSQTTAGAHWGKVIIGTVITVIGFAILAVPPKLEKKLRPDLHLDMIGSITIIAGLLILTWGALFDILAPAIRATGR